MKESIKLILQSVRSYKKYAIITPLFMVGEALLECFLPFVMSMFVDLIQKITCVGDIMVPFTYINDNLHLSFDISIFAVIWILVGMALLSLLCGIFGGKYAAKASVGLATNLRSDLYKKLQSFSFANIDKFSASSLVTRMTTDVTNVQQAFQMCIRIVVRAPLMMIFSTILGFLVGGHMAWIFLGLIPIVAFGLLLVMRFAMRIFIKLFKRYDKLNESVQENVSGIRVVKSYVREEFEKEKFNTASNNMTGDFVHAEKIVALSNPIMNTAVHLSNILVVGIGAAIIGATVMTKAEPYDGKTYEVVWGSLSIGQLSSLITYGIQILMSLMMISMILVFFIMSLESVRRIGEVLKEEPTIKSPENPVMEVKNGQIDFNNVFFKYSQTAEKNTLENIDLHIKSGEFIGILGATGSGKTSIVNLISRLYDVSEGNIEVAGIDVRNYDLKTLRDNVAVVLQKNVLFSGTISSNLRWGNLEATDEQLVDVCKIAQADEFIQQFPDKYETKIEQGGTNVSGGQKQRLCIARALLKEPQILILDDSTSAVDTKTDRLIRTSLRKDLPKTTKIVIAQRISSIEDADQIIIVEDGHISQIGKHEELLKSSKYYQEIYETQNRVGGNK